MKLRIIVTFILVFGILISGCTVNEYKQITKTKKGISFTFECPVSYVDQKNNMIENGFEDLFYRMEGQYVASDFSNVNTALCILCYDNNEQCPNAKLRLESDLKNFSNLDNSYEYELLKRSEVIICGINAYFIYYKMRANIIGEYLEPEISYFRTVYLDYLDKTWEIDIWCRIELNDQVEKEFEHIINSLKFLD